jgi:hypothetical protein
MNENYGYELRARPEAAFQTYINKNFIAFVAAFTLGS